MDQDEHRRRVQQFFDTPSPQLVGPLHEPLYALSELGLWPDYVDSVSIEQAVLCWKVVERLRTAAFPTDLVM